MGQDVSVIMRRLPDSLLSIGSESTTMATSLAHSASMRHAGSKRMSVRTVLGLVGEEWCRHPMIMP